MPKKLTTKEYFNLIKENHKKYLEQNMVTHLEVAGILAEAKLVKRYADQIGDYREDQSAYLNSAIEQPSTAATVGHGALAALLGIGVAGATYYAQNVASPIDVINPLAGARNIVGGVFSATIGTGVTYLAYQAWLASTRRPANDDARKEFDAEMQKAGFTEARYEELSKELVKLFHYRECLLLGLKDNTGKNMREDFIEKHSIDGELFNEGALNVAIEAYFLDQLNKLFNEAFADIYNIQDDKIRQEKEQYRIITWLKSYFEKPGERQKFTQQLQIQFMEQCQNYLAAQMVEPGFFAKYPLATSSITGLIAGSIALGLATAIIGGPITLSIAAIGLVIFCLAAVGTYFAVNNIESLKFKRGVENRSALQHAIDDIKSESRKLKRLIKAVEPTTDKDLKQLEEYNAEGVPQGFLAYFNIFSTAKKQVAMGASTAWIREHSIRYRHSKQVEIDLSAQHQGIINNGEAQTAEMQGLLLEVMRSKKRDALPAPLKNFIDDTHTYLINPDNQDFIKRFELVEKIKQQVLEIVAVIPPQYTKQTKLPLELVTFYTLPVNKGGLGGLYQDLEQVRSLAPIVAPRVQADAIHPYQEILVCAKRFNHALTRAKNAFILRGDDTYRQMVGLGGYPSERIENKINASNIQKYLNASYDFLYSLNKGLKIGESSSDKPFENTAEFVLYRTLLLKQLASLADPSNARVTDEVRREINKFAREKLHIDPKVVFDDILHQSLFFQEDDESPKLRVGDFLYPINELAYIADAIRLDLAYISKPITPRMMIAQEAKDFLMAKPGKTMFSYEKSMQILQPEASAAYVEKIKDTIATTDEFITAMAKSNTLKKNGSLASYLLDCLDEITTLRKAIDFSDQQRKSRVAPENFDSPELAEAEKALREYQESLEEILNIRRDELLAQSNMMASNIRFGEYAKPAINLDDWVEVIMDQPISEEVEVESPLDASLNFEESMIVVPDSKTIAKEDLVDFINAIDIYLTNLEKEWGITFFNTLGYSKIQRKEAANVLKGALEKLQNGEDVSADFLTNEIYSNDNGLKGLISQNLVRMGVTDINQLFTPPRPVLS